MKKKISFKTFILIIVVLFFTYLAIDIALNWDEAVEAFYKGYNDMNQINESKYGK